LINSKFSLLFCFKAIYCTPILTFPQHNKDKIKQKVKQTKKDTRKKITKKEKETHHKSTQKYLYFIKISFS